MDLADYFSVFLVVICLICNVLVQITTYRYFLKQGLLKSVFFGFGIGLLVLFLLEFRVYWAINFSLKEFVASTAVDLITYISLGYCYFHFINLGETARRIRILRELKDSGEGLTLNEFLARYNAQEIFENRISRLLKNGQIILVNGKYYIGKSFLLYMAGFLVFLKFILMRKKDEAGLYPW